MKRKTSYSRGPYQKRQRERIDEEVIEEMLTELREFSYRIQRLFDISHYRSRIVESLQREIDCLEKIRKKRKERDDEIQELSLCDMSEENITEEKELRELYVLKNPFREENLLDVVISNQPIYSDQPGLPVNGKIYAIPRNEVRSDYVVNSLSDETINKSISGNITTILKIQNNQTEILTYIVNILFNEVNNPIKEILKRIKQEIQNLQTQPIDSEEPLEGISLEIESLKSKLELIENEIKRTNENLEKLLNRI